MPQQLIKATILIDGMTCVSCENRIEQALRKTAGIVFAQVSYSTGKAQVTYDANVTGPDAIASVIESHDYTVRRTSAPAAQPSGKPASGGPAKQAKANTAGPATRAVAASQGGGHGKQGAAGKSGATGGKASAAAPAATGKTNINQVLGVGMILAAVFMVSNRLGLFNLFNAFPEAEAGMGYGVLFLIGMLTSVHCVAMCGGINLSQCVPSQAVTAPDGSRRINLRPSLLYNLGRVISYTTIGGIVGALGQAVTLSGKAKGLVAIVAGIFMVIMGLNMLNLFPFLRRFNPRMPKIFARKVNQAKAGSSNSPLYVGLLNGLMPCGPLQAMQIYALSTGSPIKGALSMMLFSLGTVPLMFGLGALSSLLSKRFTQKMMQVSAMLVIILGVFMFQNGMGVSGLTLPSLSQLYSSSDVANPASGAAKGAAANGPVIEDGVQIVTTQLKSGSYAPITVKAGIPVRWTIKAEKGTVNGCNNRIIIPQYKLEKKLVVGDNVIEFTPDKAGTVPFSCWMGMIRSKITVVPNDGAAPVNSKASETTSSTTALAKAAPGNTTAPSTAAPTTIAPATTAPATKAPATTPSTTAPKATAPSGTSASTSKQTTQSIAGKAIATPSTTTTATTTAKAPQPIPLAACCGGKAAPAPKTQQRDIQAARMVDGRQSATITVDSYGFSPQILVVQKGVRLSLSYDLRQPDSCNSKIVVWALSTDEIDLGKGEKVPAFTPKEDFAINCWMGMTGTYVKVVDDLKTADLAQILEDINNEFGGPGEACH